jgi:hypothetical protein
MANPRASLSSCQNVVNQLFIDNNFATNVIGFLNTPNNSAAYPALASYLLTKAYIYSTANGGVWNSFKIMLVLDDGTVIVDTSKETAQNAQAGTPVVNTFAAYVAGDVPATYANAINVNHNTRPEILNATLSERGIGVSRRYSGTSSAVYQYYAVRLGNSPQDNLGTLRVAYQE